jgi:hypothetical protein
VIEVQELADFIRESCSQLFRFTARNDRLADAHNRLVAVAICLRLNDRLCTHSLAFRAEARGATNPKITNLKINDDLLPLQVAKVIRSTPK